MSESYTFMRAVPAGPIEQKPLSDGRRMLTGRLVPYDVIADVADPKPSGGFDIYQEGFHRGAFDGQVINGANNKGVLSRIGLIHRHEGGLGYLGPFVGLREADDGLYGDIMVLPTKANDVAALLEAGVNELSIEFRLRHGDNTFIDAHGVRWRTKAHLDQVALEPKGAYSGAQVLALRAEQDELEKQKREAEAAEVEKDQEREAAEAAAAEVRENAEKEAAAALERRRAFQEMADKLEAARDKQKQYEKDYYGYAKPRSFDGR